MTATIHRIDSRSVQDERKAQAIVRNATAAYRSALQDAMLLTSLRGCALGDVLVMLEDLVPGDQGWDEEIDELKQEWR